jgi:hypothetical protein
MNNVVQFRPRRVCVSVHQCPYCGDWDGFVNISAQHSAICTTHKVYWYLGANLLWPHACLPTITHPGAKQRSDYA